MKTWPKPAQKPHPPIIVGGAFRLAARRAIRYGDGITTGGAERRLGQPGGVHAALAPNGRGSRPRPRITVGDFGRCAGRP